MATDACDGQLVAATPRDSLRRALTTIVHAEAQELLVDGMSAAPASIVEERPTTRLPLADLTNLARIDELLGSDKLDEAIDLLVVAFEQPRPKPVLHLESAISADGRIGQTYWPASLIAQARFARLCETRPLWLVAYRERVDRRANSRYSKHANKVTWITNRICSLHSYSPPKRRWRSRILPTVFWRPTAPRPRSIGIDCYRWPPLSRLRPPTTPRTNRRARSLRRPMTSCCRHPAFPNHAR
ncbi:MAG: hypothetical protein R3B96_16795 [Pirellulaceae bacterium]